jgi:hypothetical protein
MKKKSLLLLFSILSVSAFAQDDIDELLRGGKADANKLVEGYISPFLKVFGYGLNQGWYNTAKNHKTLGVDLTVSVSAVYIPNSDLFYTVNNSQLTTVRLENTGTSAVSATGSGNVPTLFGPATAPIYRPTSTTGGPTFGVGGSIDLKKDLGIQALPVPIANLGIGLPKGIDLKFRFVPQIDFGGGKFNLFGVGVMHDIKQYIPGVKSLPFDLAAFVGYTKMKLSVSMDEANPANADQKGTFETSATTIQGLISKKVSVLTVYGGVGYNIANTKLGIKGAYDFDENGSKETIDPVSVEASSSGPRVTAGMRLKLAVFTFHGDYTLQKYSALTVGFGIAVR